MNRIIRPLLSAGLLAAAIICLGNPVAGAKEDAAEKAMPKGSIRIERKVREADLPALAKLSFEQALKCALAAVPGGVIKAELEVEDGNLVYSFEIVGADKSITEVEVDAGNGKVLATENEDKERGDSKD
jgi:uncharacterized membrane protein YkoI